MVPLPEMALAPLLVPLVAQWPLEEAQGWCIFTTMLKKMLERTLLMALLELMAASTALLKLGKQASSPWWLRLLQTVPPLQRKTELSVVLLVSTARPELKSYLKNGGWCISDRSDVSRSSAMHLVTLKLDTSRSQAWSQRDQSLLARPRLSQTFARRSWLRFC